MKKCLCLCFVILMLLSLAACGTKVTNDSTQSDTAGSIKQSITDLKWDDFTVEINGENVTFPTSTDTLISLGYTQDASDAKREMDPGHSVSTTFRYGNSSKSFEMYNPQSASKGGKTIPGEECLILGGEFSNSENGPAYIFAGGITLDSTAEDVIASWGEPNQDYGYELIYKVSENQNVRVYVETSGDRQGMLYSIIIENSSVNDW